MCKYKLQNMFFFSFVLYSEADGDVYEEQYSKLKGFIDGSLEEYKVSTKL